MPCSLQWHLVTTLRLTLPCTLSCSYAQAEVQVNADNWNVSALQQPQANEEEQAGAEDEMWENFRTIEEQKRKQAEEQRKLKEQQEEELRKVGTC